MNFRDPFNGLMWIYGGLAFSLLLLLLLLGDWLGAWYIEDSVAPVLEAEAEMFERIVAREDTASVLDVLQSDLGGEGFYKYVFERNGKIYSTFDETPRQHFIDEEGILSFRAIEQGVESEFSAIQLHWPEGNSSLLIAVDNQLLLSDRNWPLLIFSTMLMALLLCFLLSWWLLNKIKSRLLDINRTSQSIVENGDLSQRVPSSRLGGPLAATAENLNEMLSTIDMAVEKSRQQANNIAHDLRTPLTSAYNQLQLAAKKYPELNDSEKQLSALLKTFSLLQKINDLENAPRAIEQEVFDPCASVLDALELYEPALNEKSQIIECKPNLTSGGSSRWRINGQHGLLFQSLCNLLDNASKYSPMNTLISIHMEEDNDFLNVVVEDEGPGIAVEQLDAVFLKFNRQDCSRQLSGNGLGLSFVKAAVVSMSGTVSAENYSRGLRIIIRLPLHQSD